MREGDVFEDDDGMLGGILLEKILEVRTAGAENHLVGLGVLTLGGDGDITEGLLIPQVLERGNHIGLKVVPSKAELLIVPSHLKKLACYLIVCNKANSLNGGIMIENFKKFLYHKSGISICFTRIYKILSIGMIKT